MDPLENLGQTFMGTIKSYNSQKGYGFVTCDKLEGDLFFLHRNLKLEVANEAQIGRDLSEEEIAFTCDVTPEGKPQASDIRVLEGSGKKWKKGKSKGKGKSYGGGWGEAEYYENKGKGYGKSRPKGGKGERKVRGSDPDEPGESLLDGERVIGTIRTYNNNSKWGFAVTEAEIPNAENIFIHMNNLDQQMIDQEIFVREGDIIEMRLEEIDGKPVAREIMLAPQDPITYDGQWMTGLIKSYNEKQQYGFISSPRVLGDIWFPDSDLPASLLYDPVGPTKICFKLVIGPDGKASAKMLNYVGNPDKLECVDRLKQVVSDLETEGYVDETAAKSLLRTPLDELLTILPEIEFYNAENPSSFIVGALTRYRKGGAKGGFVGTPQHTMWGEKKGAAANEEAKVSTGKGTGKPTSSSEAKGKGKGKGKAGKSWRAAPY